MELRHIDTPLRLSGMGNDLWYHPVQIRRRAASDHGNPWSAFGAVLPLGSAVRDALKLLERETVTIHFVYPDKEVSKLNEIDILYLSRRADYPFRNGAR
jgi:hypothetical protein